MEAVKIEVNSFNFWTELLLDVVVQNPVQDGDSELQHPAGGQGPPWQDEEDHLHRGWSWTGPRQNTSQKAGNCINSFLNSNRIDNGVIFWDSFNVLQNEPP